MPKLRPPLQRPGAVSELMHSAHAHRLAVGWLVAREAGLDPAPFTSELGGQLMERWQEARNLPQMVKMYQPQARLMYRIRALCLQLHHHRSALVCGGPEMWWQLILEEQILGAICDRVAPQVFPEAAGVPIRSRAASAWWLRRGINACNPHSEPATWALVEATQARVYPSRVETGRPADDVPLPIAALNGQLSLTQRKALLKAITGSVDGHRAHQGIELARDWAEMLITWQETAKETKAINGKSKPTGVEDLAKFEAVAVLLHDALMPNWWANVSAIREGLNQIPQQKPSDSSGSGALQKIEPTHAPEALQMPSVAARMYPAAKKGASQSANPAQSPLAANAPQSSNKAAMSKPNHHLSGGAEP